ncbi:MAG TPA: transposase, partial [Acidobacteriota bacterium]|nr:transposase [Acidobacteriota bacterium]
MDVHSTTTEVCVRNGRGKIVLRRRIESTKTGMEEFILSIAGRKRVVVEESQMADWVTRVLQPHADEVIRCQPQHNRLISKSEDKCDETDSESLSELLYLDRLKPVHHPGAVYRELREAVRAYWIASQELTRAKNRLKAFFLFNGLHEIGGAIFCQRRRDGHLKRLEEKEASVKLARLLYERMDHCRQLKGKHIRVLRDSAEPVQELVGVLKTIPAIGPISAYTLVAYLEDGRRIPNKRKLWRYAGLSLRRHESRGIGTEGASYTGNRRLKHVVMSAAITVVSQTENNGLSKLWEREIRQKVDPKRARRNLAR